MNSTGLSSTRNSPSNFASSQKNREDVYKTKNNHKNSGFRGENLDKVQIHEWINQIVAAPGGYLPTTAGQALDHQIKKVHNFDEGIRLVKEYCAGDGSNQAKKIPRYIYQRLLALPANEFDKVDYLFNQIPLNQKVRSIYQPFMQVADEANNYPAIKSAFQDAKLSNQTGSIIYNVFIRYAFKYNDFNSAQEAFQEGLDKGYCEPNFFNNFIRASSNQGFKVDEKLLQRAIDSLKKSSEQDPVEFNGFIFESGEKKYIQYAKEAFEEAKRKNIADAATYVIFAKAAAKSGRFDYVEQTMKEVEKNKTVFTDNYFHNAFISLAGNFGKREQAYKAFNDLKKRGVADPVSYTAIISVLGNGLGNYEEIKSLYLEAKKKFKQLDDQFYTCFLHIAGQFKKFKDAQEIYQEGKNRTRNPIFHSTYLDIAAHNGRFDEVKKTFLEQKKFKDIEMFNHYIRAAGIMGYFVEAKNTFEEILKEGFADSLTYSLYIKAALKNKQYAAAKYAFEKAKANNMANAQVFINFIEAASASQQFQDVQKAMEDSKKSYINDQRLDTQYMVAAIQNKRVGEVRQAMEETQIKYGMTDKVINVLIDAYGEGGYFEEAKKLFEKAEEDEILNNSICSTYLNLLFKMKKFEEAKELFEEIVQNGMADRVTYHIYMNIAAENKDFPTCKKTFETSKALNLNNEDMYRNFIKHAGDFKKYEEAKEVYEEGKKLYPFDTPLHTVFMHVAFLNNDLKTGMEVYEFIRKETVPTSYVYSNFMQGMADTNQFKMIKEAFEEAKRLNLADHAIYTIYISAAAKNGQKEEAIKAFKESLKYDWLDWGVYATYMNAIEVFGQFDLIEEAFQDAQRNKIENIELYTTYITLAGRFGKFEKAEEIYKKLLKENKFDESTLCTIISIAGMNLQFQDAKWAFEIAVKNYGSQTLHFNAYMTACKRNSEYEEFEKTFEKAKELNIADSHTYCVYMQYLGYNFGFLEAKKCFDEAVNKKLVDPYIWHGFIEMAGQLDEFEEAKKLFDYLNGNGLCDKDIYQTYISVAGKAEEKKNRKIAEAKKIAFLIANESLDIEFKDIKEQYRAALECDLIDATFFNSYIHIALQADELEEADQALQEAEKRQVADSISRNLLMNWELQKILVETPSMSSLDVLNVNERKCVKGLLSSAYNLLFILESNKKDKPFKPKKIPIISDKLIERVHKANRYQSGKHQYEMVTAELLQDFVGEAKECGLFAYPKIVGGAVPYCSGPQPYKKIIKRLAGNNEDSFFNAEIESYFHEVSGTRFKKKPKDWDYAIELESEDSETIDRISNVLPKKISDQNLIPVYDVKKYFFEKENFISDDGNIFSIRRIGNDEFVVGKKKRSHLFLYDSLYISLENFIQGVNKGYLKARNGSEDEAVRDYILKRLRAEAPETINQYGWGTYFARLAQGCCCDDFILETILCKKVIALSPDERVRILSNAYHEHCRENPQNGLIMLFQACSALCDAGFIKEAEELRVNVFFSEDIQYEHPFFNELAKIWLIEKLPLLQVRAVMEAIAFFHLLMPNLGTSMICKIEEHKKKQYLQINIQGGHLLLPFSTANTFNILSFSSNSPTLPSLRRFFNAVIPNLALQKDLHFSESIAQFLSIDLNDLDKCDEHWPELGNLCRELKGMFQQKPAIPVVEAVKEKKPETPIPPPQKEDWKSTLATVWVSMWNNLTGRK